MAFMPVVAAIIAAIIYDSFGITEIDFAELGNESSVVMGIANASWRMCMSLIYSKRAF